MYLAVHIVALKESAHLFLALFGCLAISSYDPIHENCFHFNPKMQKTSQHVEVSKFSVSTLDSKCFFNAQLDRSVASNSF